MDCAENTGKTGSAGIRFDRNEFAGAFGDIGTTLPLIFGICIAAKVDAVGVLIMFGLMQIFTGLVYKIPMAVQPLKAMAAIVISQKIDANILFGGGLAIGVVMLILTISGLIEWLSQVIPKCVIRGIQFGLGLQLATLAFKEYVNGDGIYGYWLAGIAFILAVIFLKNRKYPAALLLISLGLIYAFTFKAHPQALIKTFSFNLPQLNVPTMRDIIDGFLLLALPQLPLSIGNSILATRQIVSDLFPGACITSKKIGFTYSIMNLINPFLGGIPTCHGSGGIAGHYTFGARTGGSVIIIGSLYVIAGLLFGNGLNEIVRIFPLPVLGVILLFEGTTLMLLINDLKRNKQESLIAMLIGLIAIGIPYGFLLGTLIGLAIYYFYNRNSNPALNQN